MKKTFGMILVIVLASTSFRGQQTQGVWSGRLSDSMCGISHAAKATAGTLSERQCVFECIKALAKYVLVDDTQQVIRIANQDLGGLPLFAGRLVTITGEMKDGAIVATKVEAIAAHLHLGHVMTNWRDTPSNVGFLTAAISDARVAAVHADLAAKSPDNLDEMKLHAGHVLHALDPTSEPKGPGSGYGVKKSATGALQHLGIAVKAQGGSSNIETHAAHVSASLNDVLQWTDHAIAVAQRVRSAGTASEAVKWVNDLAALAKGISEGIDANRDGQVGWQSGEGGLQQAKTHMDLLMRGEGLENAPR